MPFYDFECENGHIFEKYLDVKNCSKPHKCKCGKTGKRIYAMPAVTNTKDGFGFKNAFRDKKTGKEITTWGEWEKAGYRDGLEFHHDKPVIVQEIKRKLERIRKYDGGNRRHFIQK